MRQNRFFLSSFTVGVGLAVLVVALSWTAPAAAQSPRHDPVEQLRRDLRDGLDNNAAARNDRALTSLYDLRRALELTDWKSGPIDRALRTKLADRFLALLRAALESPEVAVRWAAATVVAEIGVNSSPAGDLSPAILIRALVPEFVKLLRDADPRVRIAAAQGLGKMGAGPTESWDYKDKKAIFKLVPSSALPAMKPMLESRSPTERRAAAQALLGMVRDVSQYTRGSGGGRAETTQIDLLATGTAVAPLVRQALTDTDAEVRRLGVETILQSVSDLGLILSLRARIAAGLPSRLFLPAEFRLLNDDEQAQIRKEIRAEYEKVTAKTLDDFVKTLGQAGEGLVKHLRDTDPEVRLLVRRTLEELARVRLGLSGRLPAEPARMVRAGRKTGDLIRTAARASQNDGIVQAAGQEAKAEPQDAIGKALEKVPAILSEGTKLDDPDLAVRLASIDLLERLGDEAAPALPALIERLDKDKEPDRFVRWAAARVLGKTLSKKDPRADQKRVTPALARLLTDTDPDVRLTAAITLESYGPSASQAVNALIEGTGAGDVNFRRASIHALIAIGPASRRALPALLACLSDLDPRMRQVGAEALGKLAQAGDKTVVAALRKALTDENGNVRQAAGEALVNILQGKK
jgi:HEAT repeat protein